MTSEPWGYKVTVHVYVEGDLERAVDVSDFYASLAPVPEPEFVGTTIEAVAEKPRDQGVKT